MKFATLVLALAFGASSAFVAPIAHRSLAPRAPTLAARSRPDFRRDTVKVQLAVPALPPAFSPGPEVVGGTTAAALAVLMAEDGMASLLEKAIRAARDKSVELGG